jgi:cytochrome P450
VLYSQNLPLEKSPFYINQFEIPAATFSTIPHAHHRLRRSAIAPYFSKAMISCLEPLLSTLVAKLCSRIEEYRQLGQPVSLRPAYSAFTTDVVTNYCFNKSWEHLEHPDFDQEWQEVTFGTMKGLNLLKQAPWLYKIVRAMPVVVVEWLAPTFKMLFAFENVS